MILANSCSPSDCFLIKTELFLRKLPKAKERPTTRVKVKSIYYSISGFTTEEEYCFTHRDIIEKKKPRLLSNKEGKRVVIQMDR